MSGPNSAEGPPEDDRVIAFFGDNATGLALFRDAHSLIDSAGRSAMRVTKSQISFRRSRAFAWAWMPGRWLRSEAAPLVISLALTRKDESSRWKEVVEPIPGRWMHHLEVWQTSDMDDEFERWIREAFEAAA